MSQNDLNKSFAELRVTRIPDRDLWPEIEDRITGAHKKRSAQGKHTFVPLIAAAAACLLVFCGALSAGIFLTRSPQSGPELTGTSNRQQRTLSLELHKAEKNYERAKQKLMKSLRALGGFYGNGYESSAMEKLADMDNLLGEMKKMSADSSLTRFERDYKILSAYNVHLDYLTGSENLIRSIMYGGE